MNPVVAFAMALAAAESNTDIQTIVNGMETLLNVVKQVWTVMVSNPFFVVFLGASLFSLGIWIFKKVKRAARG